MTQSSPRNIRPIGCVRFLAIIALIVVVVALRACFLRPMTNYPGSHFNRHRNATWLGVEWSMEPHRAEAIAALVANLQAQQITTIYVYVSYLKPTGGFNPTYDHAVEFVSSLKRIAPKLDVQGWLGIPVKAPEGYPLSSGYVDLNDAQTRTTIVQFSRFVVQTLGFDGVHLDPEPILSADTALLALLDDTRAAIGPHARLSIAAREITPLLSEADLIINRWFTWRADYYREVAKRVDQLAVMTYDSHAPLGLWYEQWVRHQVIDITISLHNVQTDVFIGIPTSEELSASHDPAIENMTTGLHGLIAGLNDLDAHPEKITGVAIYPYWETTEEEWATYRSLWLDGAEN